MFTRRHIGHGLGLRPAHYAEVLATRPPVGYFELISENFMVRGGNPRRVLHAMREAYPLVLHGVAMSLGSPEPLDDDYLGGLARLIDDAQPAWVSDHLCWSRLGAHTVHDLWPLPFDEATLDHVVARVQAVQARLGRQLLVENVSSYVQFRASTMTEWEFLAALAERADCGLLLDLNNVHVSACNHGFDATTFIDALPAARVGQLHLAGHSVQGALRIDTHDHPVAEPVWDLYRHALTRLGPVSTLVEWDAQLPPLARLVEESARAAALEAAHGGRDVAA